MVSKVNPCGHGQGSLMEDSGVLPFKQKKLVCAGSISKIFFLRLHFANQMLSFDFLY